MKPIKVGVTLSGETKTSKFSHTFIRDYTEYAETLIKCNNIFDNTGEKMTEENIEKYFSAGEFSYEDIEKNNGSHFLFGFMETLAQSDECPECIRYFEGDLKIKVETY